MEIPVTEKETLREKTFIEDFDFGEETALVFDTMLERSIPFYSEIQRMIVEIASDFAIPGTRLYDLGCSTGTTLSQLASFLPSDMRFIGIDFSPDMLDKARQKLNVLSDSRCIELVCKNIDENIAISNASVVVMSLTLQFVRPIQRGQLIQRIAEGLHPEGCFILIEKVLGENPKLHRRFIQYYYHFKRQNGYSELEIAQKREALENVLIPYYVEENRELLQQHGFKTCEVFFRWYNFCGMIALK